MSSSPDPKWKTKAYIAGAAGGALFGLLSAYMYARSTEEDMIQGGNRRNRVQTGDLLGLGLAALAMARQIAEMGKSPEGKQRRK